MRTHRPWVQGILLSLFLFTKLTFASPGEVDTSFKAETGVTGLVQVVIPLHGGKVLVGGDFQSVQGIARPGFARLNSDGSLDCTFVPLLSNAPVVLNAAIQSDAKIIVAGYASYTSWIGRINPDGSVDKLFSPPQFFGQQISTLIIQPDGKIIVAGLFQKVGGAPGDLITRLNTDGSVDASFNLTAFENYYDTLTVALQPDGKIVASLGMLVSRFNADGSPDPSFSPPNFSSAGIDRIAAQADGRLLLAGRFQFVGGGGLENLIRLNDNGSLDTNFVRQLRRNDAYSFPSILLEDQGGIRVLGFFSTKAEIFRLNNEGVIGTDFVIPDGATTDIRTMALDIAGNILIGGGFAWSQGIANVGRLHADGSLDISFQPGFTLSSVSVPKVVVDSECRAIAALSSYPSGVAIQRFNLDGSADKNFTTAALSGSPTALILQKDGKILAASQYTTVTSHPSEVKRLNQDGTLDDSFKFKGASESIAALVQQPDGKILIGGAFTTLNALAADRVARLNLDGSVDRSFQSLLFLGSPAVEYDFAQTLALQPDGKILVGLRLGWCGCAGVKPMAVIRLNADGSYDSSFDSSSIVPLYVDALLPQPDGKILVGGFQFSQSTANAIPRHGLVRLNADGSLDAAFITPLLMGSDVRAIFIDANGQILINSVYNVLRLNPNGALDSIFHVADSDNGEQDLTALALSPDGNVYFSGSFTSVNHVPRPKLVRLFGSPVPIPLKTSSLAGEFTFNWSNPALHLQSAPSVQGPYEDVQEAKSPWKPSPSVGQQFFRLRSN